MDNQKTVFISYSWDSEEHKDWVRKLSRKLEEYGIRTILDQKDLQLGDLMTLFMESSVSESDYVLLICSPRYKEKADRRVAGVGYEEMIITADVYAHQNHRKYIPVLAVGSWAASTPLWAAGKLGVDLSDSAGFEEGLQKLVKTILGSSSSAPNSVPVIAPPISSMPLHQVNPTPSVPIHDDERTFFGAFRQRTDTPRKDPIEWLILKKEPGRLLLLSRYALDCRSYLKSALSEKSPAVTWSASDIRKWLNTDFLETAFSMQDRLKILETFISDDAGKTYVKDKVFLLSEKEAEVFFRSDNARKCTPTTYASSNGALVSTNYDLNRRITCWWWLRSVTPDGRKANSVYFDGTIGTEGTDVSAADGCIRPAIWILQS